MDVKRHMQIAQLITDLLDNKFSFFGYRFGLNGIIGFVPGLGDLIVALVSLYLVWIGIHVGIPKAALLRMGMNVAVNFLVGLLPVVGDFADFFHKANMKNLRILKQSIRAKESIIEGEIIEK